MLTELIMSNSNFLKIIVPIYICLILSSCTQKTKPPLPLSFDIATQKLAKDLLKKIEKNRTLDLYFSAKKIVMDDFSDEETGDTIKVGEEIEAVILKEAKNNFHQFSLSKMNSKNIVYADYIINGVISFEHIKNNRQGEKYYHIFASAIDRKTGNLVAKSSAWVLGRDLDFTPTKEYKDGAMLMSDNRHKSKVAIARGLSKTYTSNDYYKSIETNAILTEASSQYGKNKYRSAATLFSKVAERSDGQIMKTYAGLYQTHLKLGQTKKAEKAFGKLLEISINNKNLSIKFLFAVNSTNFIVNKTLKKRYLIWLRQVGKVFNTNQYCAEIIGHSSHTGEIKYNDKLSKQRAVAIQRQIKPYFKKIKKNTITIGKGFRENIKGLGTDDNRDAIDRRVEFKIIQCSTMI